MSHCRLSNWNTGRLFMGDDFGMGVSEYGAVAVGTGDRALIGQNAQVSKPWNSYKSNKWYLKW